MALSSKIDIHIANIMAFCYNATDHALAVFDFLNVIDMIRLQRVSPQFHRWARQALHVAKTLNYPAEFPASVYQLAPNLVNCHLRTSELKEMPVETYRRLKRLELQQTDGEESPAHPMNGYPPGLEVLRIRGITSLWTVLPATLRVFETVHHLSPYMFSNPHVLEELTIPSVRGPLYMYLRQFSRLRRLTLRGWGLGEVFIMSFDKDDFPCLEYVSMSIHGLFPLNRLRELRSLASLDVTLDIFNRQNMQQIMPRLVSCVEGLLGLESLTSLSADEVDFGSIATVRCSNLECLSLSGLNEETLRNVLLTCKKLKQLYLCHCRATSKAFKGVSLPLLRELSLGEIIVSDRIFARFIRRSPDIRFFQMAICSIGDKTCMALSRTKLEHFQIFETRVTPKGISHVFVPSLRVFISDVRHALPKKMLVSRVNLAYCDLEMFKRLVGKVSNITIKFANLNGSMRNFPLSNRTNIAITSGLISRSVDQYLTLLGRDRTNCVHVNATPVDF